MWLRGRGSRLHSRTDRTGSMADSGIGTGLIMHRLLFDSAAAINSGIVPVGDAPCIDALTRRLVARTDVGSVTRNSNDQAYACGCNAARGDPGRRC